MSKGILEFDLNDPSEKEDHARACAATDMAIALFEIQTNIPREIGRLVDDGILATASDVYDEFVKKINMAVEEQGIDFEKILT